MAAATTTTTAARVTAFAGGVLRYPRSIPSPASYFLKPFSASSCALRLSSRALSSPSAKGRRFYTCRAIYNPEVQIKGEGQPETLDYRVFFVDHSGKKVRITFQTQFDSQGTLTAIRDWFRDYKIPDGKPANKFGLGNKAANKDYALKVIKETNESWAKLVKRSIPANDLSLV
ncbi:unnamed protein product [Linum tenue]|uniref:inorganic diphosphatase n=1 Tax=Linum tenue TaxID=586396 RepID=A0AAV0IQC3_9ROSI|nr:unnamed protein product [Linum tenue]